MNPRGRVSRCAIVLASLLVAIGLLVSTADAAVVTGTVKCSEGQSIGAALEKAGSNPLVVVIQGNCNENVTITRDDVTLQGDPATGGAVIAATPALDAILIDGARRVVIESLTVSGGQNGIAIARGASAIARNSTIQNSVGDGIRVVQSSHALIHNNLVENNAAVGVLVLDGSSATITANKIRLSGEEGVLAANSSIMRVGRTDTGGAAANTIENNTRDGVSVTRGSTMELRANIIQNNGIPGPGNPFGSPGVSAIQNSTIRSRGGNTIKSNGSNGIFLRSSDLRTGNDSITENTFSGIFGEENSTIHLSGNTLVANNNTPGFGLFLQHGARILAETATISGNDADGISLTLASSVRFGFGSVVTIMGNGGFGLFCGEPESSFIGTFSGGGNASGDISISCTGF